MKKIITLILAVVFVLLMAAPALAQDPMPDPLPDPKPAPGPSGVACEAFKTAAYAYDAQIGPKSPAPDSWPGPICKARE